MLHVHMTWGKGVSPRVPSSLPPLPRHAGNTDVCEQVVSSRADLLVERQLVFPDLSPPPLQPYTSPPGWRLKRQEVPSHPYHPISTGQNPSCAPNPGLPAPSCPLAPSPHPSAAARTLPSLLATPLRLAPGLCPLPGMLSKILCWTVACPTSPPSAPGYSRCCSSGRSCSAVPPTPAPASSLAT